MNIQRRLAAVFAAFALCAIWAFALPSFAAAQQAPAGTFGTESSPPAGSISEINVVLYVLDPHMTGNRKGITLAWIPDPLVKYCLGKTHDQCAMIDYCIRTTNKMDARCKDLGVDTAHITFPAGMVPRRMISVTLFYPFTLDNGFGDLKKFYEGAPGARSTRSGRAIGSKPK